MKKGWQIKRLGDICKIVPGRKPTLKSLPEKGDLPFLAAKVIRGTQDAEYASPTDRNAVLVSDRESIIICTGSSSGEVFTGINGILASTMGKLAVRPEVNSAFLHAFIESHFSLLNGALKGMAIPSLDRDLLYSLTMPLPPLAEQQRIVGLLDEALDGLATAKANAEKNLQNAHDLYAVTLEAFFRDSAGCETVELGSLIELLTDYHANGSYEVLRDNVELKDSEDFAWMVRSTDFEKEFQNEMRYITKSAYHFLKKSQVFGGEIIMSKIGNAGKVYLMPEITRPCSLAMNLFLIRLNDDKASNTYVYRFLKSERGEKQILSKLKGAATQTITKESVRSLQIPLLPRSVQDRFVSKLEDIEAETQRLARLYERKHAALEALKKSLLHQAFTGEM